MNPRLKQVLFVADGSESAAACWPQTRALVTRLIEGLEGSFTPRLALLGTGAVQSREQWTAGAPFPVGVGQAPSLIAPVMAAARDWLHEVAAVVIVGAGEVFDLADWARRREAWLLVQAGEEPLAPEGEGWQVWGSEALESLSAAIAARAPGGLRWPADLMSGAVGQDWALDPAGGPMVYVPPVRGYVHLFPVLRAQFEVFVARARPPAWRDSGYTQWQRAATPRAPAWRASANNYEGAFLGAALPEDVSAYQAWCGPGFRPLTHPEWLAAWKWLAGQAPSVLRADLDDALEPSARELWRVALRECGAQTLLDVSFMRHGLIEWVKTETGEWTGTGKPRQVHPFHDPLHDPPLTPTSQTWRGKWLGFRLMQTHDSGEVTRRVHDVVMRQSQSNW